MLLSVKSLPRQLIHAWTYVHSRARVFATEMDFGREICSKAQQKSAVQESIFHFRSRSATESTRTEFRHRK